MPSVSFSEFKAESGHVLFVDTADWRAGCGREDAATIISIPAGVCVSIQQLKIDPIWHPIRHDPGFQQLLSGQELIGPPSNRP